MNKVQFEIIAISNPIHGPELQFEIKHLTEEQEELVYGTFEKLFGQQHIVHGENFLEPGSKTFASIFTSGNDARIFFGVLQELGINFELPMQIREKISVESNRLIQMQGQQRT